MKTGHGSVVLPAGAGAGAKWNTWWSVPVSGGSNPDFVRGLDTAFAGVTAELVDWTLRSI